MKNSIFALLMTLFSSFTFAEDNLIEDVPEKWRKEVFIFPLQFAPSIELEGLEEVYFAPGMFKPDASDYFNYIFLWHLEDTHHWTINDYEGFLLEYFKGLFLAVSKAPESTKTAATESFNFQHLKSNQTLHTFKGEWLDPFNADINVDLRITIESQVCESTNKTNVLFRITSKGNTAALKQLNVMQLPSCL